MVQIYKKEIWTPNHIDNFSLIVYNEHTVKEGDSKMEKVLCLDMDGTIADLYSVPDWLKKLRSEDSSPYYEAAPIWDIAALNRELHRLIGDGWKVRIISWLSKQASPEYKDSIRRAKRAWLSKHKIPFTHANFVAYGTDKNSCARRAFNGGTAILADDDDGVRGNWRLGATINPKTQNLIDELKKL